jgi:hypothetical protein
MLPTRYCMVFLNIIFPYRGVEVLPIILNIVFLCLAGECGLCQNMYLRLLHLFKKLVMILLHSYSVPIAAYNNKARKSESRYYKRSFSSDMCRSHSYASGFAYSVSSKV